MCLHQPYIFTDCPCKFIRLQPCPHHLKAQESANSENTKHWYMHPSTYAKTWEAMPDTVLDMKKCPLFFEDPIEVIDGDCRMTREGCPYVEGKEKWLDDALLVWKGGEGLDGADEVEEKAVEDGMQRRSKTLENPTLKREEVPTRNAISINTDIRGKEKPLGTPTLLRDKALPPPPGEPVSPEPILGIDPRVVFKMIPDFHP